MKKAIKIFLLVIILVSLGATMANTVPTQKEHRDAMKEVMGRVASQVAQEKTSGVTKALKAVGLGNEEKTQKGYDKVGKAMAPTLVKMIEVENYYVCSVGLLEYEGSTYPVSLGIFGHVFILPLDKIKTAMNDK